jgi:antitoxin ParD1/3/4
MGSVEKITVSLTPEMAEQIRTAVKSGEFASTSEVIRDAMREWKERRDLFGYTLEELRALVQEGIDSGPSSRQSMAEIKAEARRRYEIKHSGTA